MTPGRSSAAGVSRAPLIAALVIAVLACAGEPRPAGEARIVLTEADGTVTIDLVGLPRAEVSALARLPADELARLPFEVRTAPDEVRAEAAADRPPVWGELSLTGDGRLRFAPRFPLAAGLTYSATWRPKGRPPVTASLRLERATPEASTRVTAVYPSADVLPANLLRMYVVFSAPMSRGEAERRITLLDADGQPVEAPFVVPHEELWDPEQRRLTLLFDPGRIKRNVAPNVTRGPPLAAGHSYRLVIDPAWPDARGAPLVAGHEKSFTTAAEDRESPNPESWRLSPPEGSSAPLILHLSEPLDHALLVRLPRVFDEAGREVPGTVEVSHRETRWTFRSDAPWPPGRYELIVPPDLEDPAGNNLHQPFDTPTGQVDSAPPSPVRLTFEVR